ncbi:hypothetical protein ACRWOO_11405 [Streptomyces sp. NEAU-PBA10]|uniref:hypothetical protein n=1 Tax=unclassified Streptomyces TaxID=2593676 RepID=UPI001EE3BF87|nr:hypothetical protein [Streptomyces sp. T7(2022)]MCG5121585.1 hypothetical protein [Streptomyces sp. T7(2022)]
MRYTHTIEATDNGENPTWYTLIHADAPEDHEGTAADYGRAVLRNWIDDNSDNNTTDEYGNPLLQVRVAFADDPDAFASQSNLAATVASDNLGEPSAEIAALEAARDSKLYAQLLDTLADEKLEEALTAARASGDRSANALAAFVYPAVSRPVALRMMQS